MDHKILLLLLKSWIRFLTDNLHAVLILVGIFLTLLFIFYYIVLFVYKADKELRSNLLHIYIFFLSFFSFFSVWTFKCEDSDFFYTTIFLILVFLAQINNHISYMTCNTEIWNTLVNNFNLIQQVNFKVDRAISCIIKSLMSISGIFLLYIGIYHMYLTTPDLFGGLILMSDVYFNIALLLLIVLLFYILFLTIIMLCLLWWTIKDYYYFKKYIY